MPDPTDLVEKYGEECAALAAEEEALLAAVLPASGLGDEDPPDGSFVESCLLNNERGDGILYSRLMRDKFVHVKKRGARPWLIWRDHHWEIDLMGEHIRAVENVALAYKDEAFRLDEPIRETSAKQREAEKRMSLADTAGNSEEKAEAEAEAKSHAWQVKMLRSKKEKYLRRVDRLRGKGGAEKTVWWAHHIERPLAIGGDELDQHRMQLAAPNGVIDLYSGELRPGRPRDYLLKTIAVNYPTEIEPKRVLKYLDTGQGLPEIADWERFITQVLSQDPDGVDDKSGVPQFFQRLAGYSISGDTRYHLIPIATGGGRNGKGTFFRTAQGILGEFYWTIQSELLLDQKNVRSTAGASPDILMLRGRRFVVGSETDQHRHIAAARVKEYSGGDTLNARGLFDADETNFDPTHKLWLQTNNVPTGVTKEFSLRQRVVLLNFPWLYVPDVALASRKEPHLSSWFRPMDPDLENRLTAQRSHILLWFLRGAILMQREGPNIPPRVRADLDDKQLQEDHLEQHLRSSCLQDWDPDREYGEGDVVNVPDPDHTDSVGHQFTALVTSRGHHPLDRDDSLWRYDGQCGLDPQGWTFFKEYYGHYKKWYEENVNDKRDKIPSSKSVADALRKKGFRLEAHGGQLKIYDGGIKVLGGLCA